MDRQVHSDQAGLRPSWEVKAGINKAWHAGQAESGWEYLSSNAASKHSGKALVSLLAALSLFSSSGHPFLMYQCELWGTTAEPWGGWAAETISTHSLCRDLLWQTVAANEQ